MSGIGRNWNSGMGNNSKRFGDWGNGNRWYRISAIGTVGEDWGISKDGEEEVEWVEIEIDCVGVT